MNNSFNEAYIGTNSGQLKDNSFSPNNTINKTIKLDTNNSNSISNSNSNSISNSNSNSNSISNNVCVGESTQYPNNENEIFWTNKPSILFSMSFITELWPLDEMTREQKLNAITRLVILLTLTGFLATNNYKILITGIVSIVFLVFTYKILNNNNNLTQKIKESFSNETIYETVKHNFTNPTTANPIMNILLPEIQDNPNRLQAAPSYNKAVEKAINKETQDFIVTNFNNYETIRKKLFDDREDKVDFESSMRQFYSTANTRVPNNQNEFARFCYGNMASCKDGDVEMCLRNSNQ